MSEATGGWRRRSSAEFVQRVVAGLQTGAFGFKAAGFDFSFLRP